MNLLQNVVKRHPEADRPLIDYNTGLLLEVTTLLGTIIGVDINAVSPVWAITIALIVTVRLHRGEMTLEMTMMMIMILMMIMRRHWLLTPRILKQCHRPPRRLILSSSRPHLVLATYHTTSTDPCVPLACLHDVPHLPQGPGAAARGDGCRTTCWGLGASQGGPAGHADEHGDKGQEDVHHRRGVELVLV